MGFKSITPLMERQIFEGRRAGKGYLAIAKEIGIEQSAVRYFCMKYNLTVRPRPDPGTPFCPRCKSPVLQNRRGRKKRFCSDHCRRLWWAAHPEVIQRRDTALYHKCCKYCGKEFVAYGNASRRYCCHDCYIRDRFRKDVESAPSVS